MSTELDEMGTRQLDCELHRLDPYLATALTATTSETMAELGRQIILLEEQAEYLQGEVTYGLLCPEWTLDFPIYFSGYKLPGIQVRREMDAWHNYNEAFVNLAKACYASQVASQIEAIQ